MKESNYEAAAAAIRRAKSAKLKAEELARQCANVGAAGNPESAELVAAVDDLTYHATWLLEVARSNPSPNA